MLLDYYQNHYSSNLMSVSLVGNYSLDELEQLAKENFSEVIDKDLKVKSYEDDPMYGQDALGHLIKFIPIKELRRLTIKWPQLP